MLLFANYRHLLLRVGARRQRIISHDKTLMPLRRSDYKTAGNTYLIMKRHPFIPLAYDVERQPMRSRSGELCMTRRPRTTGNGRRACSGGCLCLFLKLLRPDRKRSVKIFRVRGEADCRAPITVTA